MRALAGALVLGLSCACGPAGLFEGGAFPVQVLADLAVTPPAAPEPPGAAVLGPCPAGWQQVAVTPVGGPWLCEPWSADAGAPACAVDEARFVDADRCVVVGTPCTADDWATGLPGSNVLYVSDGAADGGVGTRAAPFATIAEAFAAASSGTTVALGKGTYTGEVRVPAGVTVWGACVAQTLLRGAAGGQATVRAGGLDGRLKNLRVTGPSTAVLANPSGNSLRLEEVVVDGAVGAAMLVGNTAQVTGRDVVVRNTQATATGAGGRGVSCEYGGRLALTRVVFENNREIAVNAAETGSRIQLTDAVIRGTRPRTDGLMGRAGTINRGAALELTRALLELNSEVALLAGARTTLTLTDVLIRDTGSSSDGGGGIVLEGGAAGVLRRVALQRNRSVAIQVRSASTLDAQHLVVADTAEATTTGLDGVGLDVVERSRATVANAWLTRNATGAVGFADGATGELTDIAVSSTRAPAGAPDLAAALQVSAGAQVVLRRLELAGSQGVALMVHGAGTSLTGGDLHLHDGVAFDGAAGGGAGLVVQGGASVGLARVAIARHQSTGVLAIDPGTQVRLEDLAVTDTASETAAGTFGRALHAQGGAAVTLTRASLEHARDTGLFVTAAAVDATHLAIRDVTKRACTVSGACDDRGGSSVVVVEPGARLTASRFLFDTSAQCGLQVATQGDASLSQGVVRRHLIGVCLQVDGFDLTRLEDRVVYEDNVRKLDAQSVPLPTLAAPIYRPRP